MAPPPAARSDRRPLDAVALQRVSRRLHAAPTPPWLHGEVARRMAERLPVIRLQPDRVLDWGAFLGASRERLLQAYPRAQWIGIEPDAARRDATARALAAPWWSPRRWAGASAPVVDESEVADGHGQMLWANMHLHGQADPPRVMQQWQRALAVDGFLMFSTLGPGTLQSLRALYDEAGWPAPHAPFVDMHDLGDMLLEAGFADPVMDQEMLTLTWPDADALLAELRSLGGNVAADRHAGLRTPRWRRELAERMGRRASADGRIALDFEVVYGHAFKPPPRWRAASETTVSLQDMKALARDRSRRG